MTAFLADPALMRALITMVYGLRNLKTPAVTANGANYLAAGKSTIAGDGLDLTLELPLLWTGGVPVDGTTTVGAAVVGTGATNAAPFGYTTAAQANAIVTRLNQLRVDVLALTVVMNLVLAGERSVQNPPKV